MFLFGLSVWLWAAFPVPWFAWVGPCCVSCAELVVAAVFFVYFAFSVLCVFQFVCAPAGSLAFLPNIVSSLVGHL